MNKVRLAVIGNGMVGHRFIEELLDKAPTSTYEITVFCEEPRVAYDRVHLSSYFAHHTVEELSLVREGYYEKMALKSCSVNAPSPSTAVKKPFTLILAVPCITIS